MQERHIRRDIYFEEQAYTTVAYVIPFIFGSMEIRPGTSVLEIGCGEGGNLRPFLEAGCEVTGVDILAEKIKNAETFFRDHPKKDKLKLIAGDIYDVGGQFSEQFDLVYMRDVIEHIHDQERFLGFAGKFLKSGGKFFLGFQIVYFSVGNENIASQSDDQSTIRKNEQTVIGNFNRYLEDLRREKSYGPYAANLAEGITKHFTKLIETFPNANYTGMLGTARAILGKVQTPEIKNALSELIAKLESMQSKKADPV